jgi:hypothetical protein
MYRYMQYALPSLVNMDMVAGGWHSGLMAYGKKKGIVPCPGGVNSIYSSQRQGSVCTAESTFYIMY